MAAQASSSTVRRSATTSDPLFLGLDVSTQSLTALIVDAAAHLVARECVRFDDELPEFGTVGGQLPNSDPHVGHAPPLMWVVALDAVLDKLARHGAALLGNVRAIAVAGQQHGSVYLRADARRRLQSLDSKKPLANQLTDIFSRSTSPIWTDSSSTLECEHIRAALGGVRATSSLTGSDCFERFTGPQIRRFYRLDPDAYEATTDIALVSSFATSLLIGDIAPIDHGDGSGMNLMDIARRNWSRVAVAATADRLGDKLPRLTSPRSAAGQLADYYSRHGLRPCTVVVGTGDNPSSAYGMGLRSPGDTAISLGTSDTVFSLMSELRTDPTGAANVFVAPCGAPMSLLCFRNGSLARERVRDRYGLDWLGFSESIESTPPGNDGHLMLPWFEPEIVPRRIGREPVHGVVRTPGLTDEDAARNCRAVVEGQVMAMRLHSEWSQQSPRQILASGGGSSNRTILQIVADVFACPVSTSTTPDAAALGAALRARDHYRTTHVSKTGTVSASVGSSPPSVSVAPSKPASEIYGRLIERYRELVARSSV